MEVGGLGWWSPLCDGRGQQALDFEFRAARVEVLRKLALEPAPGASASAGAPDQIVEQAMAAEFGFTFEQMALGLGELVALANTLEATEPCRAPRAEVSAQLQTALDWPRERVEAFLSALTLAPRGEFLSVKTDAYPWRFNRAYSYLCRPLILRTREDGEAELLWGIRRIWESGRYLPDLVYSGRLRARSAPMTRVCVTIRQGHNKEFERRVAKTFAAGGCDVTAHSLARVKGRRLESASRDDLGGHRRDRHRHETPTDCGRRGQGLRDRPHPRRNGPRSRNACAWEEERRLQDRQWRDGSAST
jgi:hypothetical protein